MLIVGTVYRVPKPLPDAGLPRIVNDLPSNPLAWLTSPAAINARIRLEETGKPRNICGE